MLRFLLLLSITAAYNLIALQFSLFDKDDFLGDLGLELLKSKEFHVESKTRIFRTNFMHDFIAHIHKLVGDKKEMLAHFFVEADVEQHMEDVINDYESEVNSISQQIVQEIIADAKYETERDYFKGTSSV